MVCCTVTERRTTTYPVMAPIFTVNIALHIQKTCIFVISFIESKKAVYHNCTYPHNKHSLTYQRKTLTSFISAASYRHIFVILFFPQPVHYAIKETQDHWHLYYYDYLEGLYQDCLHMCKAMWITVLVWNIVVYSHQLWPLAVTWGHLFQTCRLCFPSYLLGESIKFKTTDSSPSGPQVGSGCVSSLRSS